ncbi:hypothetical protein D0Z07_2402 [Hyphodiscus hymeniophilus]|uniref:Uncharacterized protein n=1 Tax=Hyphodiscus hymeniophilus TaxID=353542 RepID=A0A9P7AZ56_9HELO|nr:hypothetical protein D0Z07_2402 [Hyphodiscus hymeniophilus]
MCVKEFYGYNCGHCSVPVLRQCPLSTSNPHYPVCKFPAERPIFTDDFCHPCSRVVWNMKVLKDEEEHRARHLRGECTCEVIFDGEDREKRLHTRGGKDKGKGKGKEQSRREQLQGFPVIGQGMYKQGMAMGEPGGYGSGGGGGKPGHDTQEYESMEHDMQMVKLDDDLACWEPAAQMAAYEYAGYYIEDGQSQGTYPEPSYTVALGSDQGGQLSMGEVGSGMRWYPQHQQYYHTPQIPRAAVYNAVEDAPKGPRAATLRVASLPIGRYDNAAHPDHVEALVVPTQPLVVSSDMMRSEST